MAQHSGKGLLLKADLVADTFRDEVKAFLARSVRPPTLVGILGTPAAPSKFYADFTKKQCHELGVRFVLKTVGSAESVERADGEGVEEAIIEANEDADVDGIMVHIFFRHAFASRIYSVVFSGVLPDLWRTAGTWIPFIVGTLPCIPGLTWNVGSLFATGELASDSFLEWLCSWCFVSFEIVSPLKDVEGLHFKFHYNLYHKYGRYPHRLFGTV